MAIYKQNGTVARQFSALYRTRLLHVLLVGLALLVPDIHRPLLAAARPTDVPVILSMDSEDLSAGTWGDVLSPEPDCLAGCPSIKFYDNNQNSGNAANGKNEWNSQIDRSFTATGFSTRYRNELRSRGQQVLFIGTVAALYYRPSYKITVNIGGEGPWELALDISRVGALNITTEGTNGAEITVGAVRTQITGGTLASGSLNLPSDAWRGAAGYKADLRQQNAQPAIIRGNGATTLIFAISYNIDSIAHGSNLGLSRSVCWMAGQANQAMTDVQDNSGISCGGTPAADQGTWLKGSLSYNHAPAAVADAYTVNGTAAPTPLDVLSNDTDLEQSVLTVSTIDTAATRAKANISVDGKSITYDPSSAFAYLDVGQTATDTFSYTAIDGSFDSDPATPVTVTVKGTQPAINYLDLTFSSDGKQITAYGTSANARAAVLVPSGPDKGKTVVAGYNGSGFILLRYDVAGKIDPSFGILGKVTVPLMGNGGDQALGLTAQSDGKLVAVGKTCAVAAAGLCTDYNAVLVRLNVDGSLDTTFGVAGNVVIDKGMAVEQLNAVIVQSDGKLLAAGSVCGAVDATLCNDAKPLLVRLNSDGKKDTSFSGGGVSIPSIGGQFFALALQNDGKFVAVGTKCDDSACENSGALLVRYTNTGAADVTFGDAGQAIFTTHSGTETGTARFSAVLQQADGQIAAAGASCVTQLKAGVTTCDNSEFLLARVSNLGVADSGFGTAGAVIGSVGSGYDAAYGLTQQRDGKLLLAGFTAAGDNENFALLRYSANGALDTSFSSDGKYITDFGGGASDFAYAMSAIVNGKVVVAGTSGLDFGTESEAATVAVARYQISKDTDGDGYADDNDAFPNNPAEWVDTDGDGVGDNADAFPNNPAEWVDTDHDGTGNNADTDDDGDGVPDANDAFPLDPSESVDTDHDGIGNNADTDDDGDGTLDASDNCPLMNNADQTDSDGDHMGNLCDNCPDKSNADQLDANHDGKGDACEALSNVDDKDGDGITNAVDNCPLVYNPDQTADADHDGKGDACDLPPGEPLHARQFWRKATDRLKACADAGRPGCIVR